MLQPKATFKFPIGQVSFEEKEEEEVKKMLSINGIVKGQLLNGVCTAQYQDESLNLRYWYKVVFFDRSVHPVHFLSFLLLVIEISSLDAFVHESKLEAVNLSPYYDLER